MAFRSGPGAAQRHQLQRQHLRLCSSLEEGLGALGALGAGEGGESGALEMNINDIYIII